MTNPLEKLQLLERADELGTTLNAIVVLNEGTYIIK